MTKATYSTVHLLNKTYKIKCPDDERENLQLSVQVLNDHLSKNKTKFKRLNDFQALLLTALHTSHALITCQNQQLEQRKQLAQVIRTLEDQMRTSTIVSASVVRAYELSSKSHLTNAEVITENQTSR